MPCQASPSFSVLFLFIILFFAGRFLACPQFTNHGPFFSLPSEVEKPLTGLCISRSMPWISLTHERMLEIAVFCWDRNNMKKFMLSMSIQASVIQSPPLLAGSEAVAELDLVRYANKADMPISLTPSRIARLIVGSPSRFDLWLRLLHTASLECAAEIGVWKGDFAQAILNNFGT